MTTSVSEYGKQEEERERQLVEKMKELGIPLVYTRDFRVPLVADDEEMNCGWQTVPLPPDHEEWILIDGRSDRKTGWAKRKDLIATPTAWHCYRQSREHASALARAARRDGQMKK
jgi:hypothetical protein